MLPIAVAGRSSPVAAHERLATCDPVSMGTASGPAGGAAAGSAHDILRPTADGAAASVAAPGEVPDAFLANVMRASANPYAVLGPDGTVRFVSDPIVEILGISAAECIGRNVLEFIAPEHHIVVATAIAEFTNPDRDDAGWTGPPISVDLLHADGRAVPCRVLGVGSGTDGFHGVVVRIRQTSSTTLLDQAIAGMVTANDLDDVLHLLLDLLVEQLAGSAAAVGMAWDGSGFAHVVAGPGAPAMRPASGIDGDDVDPPWVRSLTDRIHAVAEVGALPRGCSEAAARAGWTTCWSFPIELAGACDDALVVWRQAAGAPTQHHREAIERLLQLIQLAITAHHSRRALEHQARTDPLTGLANRLALFDRLEEIGTAEETTPVGVLYCDLDDFKPINDQFGHSTGDRVLTIAAHRIASQVRTGDLVARVGGDEFAVLCLAADPARLEGLARRLLRSFDEPIMIDGRAVHLGISVGTALVEQGGSRSPAAVLHEADSALLAAKADGKGTWRSATAPLDG